ncbi:MAG: GAF domain-containing protein [bacterium]|nr:GAF domain-containing protein [bacterium]
MKKTIQRETDLRILYEISQETGTSLDLHEVLTRIVGQITHVTKCDSCFIYLFDKDKKELTLMASKNPHPRILGRIKLKLGEGITGVAAKQKKPVKIEKDASHDPRSKVFSHLPEDRYEAFLSVPVLAKGEVIGVINIQHKKPHSYNSGIITLISTIAQQVSGAIANARLYEETRKRIRHTEALLAISQSLVSDKYIDEILSLIVQFIAELAGFNICSIMLLDEKKNELVIKASQSLDREYLEKPAIRVTQSISGRAVMEKQPVVIRDVKQEKGYMFPELAHKMELSSMLIVPMLVKEKVVGVINSYTREEHEFTEEEIKLVQTIAHQTAIAIENTRLLDEVAHTREALENRKIIEKAKGILMKEMKLDEDAAYRLIHKKSMDTGRSMRSIADAVIISSNIKGSVLS